MNKREIVTKYENTIYSIIATEKVLKDLKQLDEPKEKVTLPRPVANWISCVRGRNKTLHFALENAPEEVNLWFCEDEKNRQNIFADAWVNGYHIEKEKRYIVALRISIKIANILNGTFYRNIGISAMAITRQIFAYITQWKSCKKAGSVTCSQIHSLKLKR